MNLTCQTLQRTDSYHGFRSSKENRCHTLSCPRADKNWSGQLLSPPCDEISDERGPLKATSRKRPMGRRLSTGGVIFGGSGLGVGHRSGPSLVQPKLVRSGGMRRHWSFEDLRHSKKEEKR